MVFNAMMIMRLIITQYRFWDIFFAETN